jgi:hypothetical protein
MTGRPLALVTSDRGHASRRAVLSSTSGLQVGMVIAKIRQCRTHVSVGKDSRGFVLVE